MNENQKKTTDQYRDNYDQIFKKKSINDDGQGVERVHQPLDTTEHRDIENERGK